MSKITAQEMSPNLINNIADKTTLDHIKNTVDELNFNLNSFFSNPTTGYSPGIITFTQSGTFTVPANVTKVDVFVVGGGGGGGGYVKTFRDVIVTPGEVIPIVIGAGGNAAGGASNHTAGSGGYSEFKNSAYRANGGSGGRVDFDNYRSHGGAGGSGGGAGRDGGTGGSPYNGNHGAVGGGNGGVGAGSGTYGGNGGTGGGGIIVIICKGTLIIGANGRISASTTGIGTKGRDELGKLGGSAGNGGGGAGTSSLYSDGGGGGGGAGGGVIYLLHYNEYTNNGQILVSAGTGGGGGQSNRSTGTPGQSGTIGTIIRRRGY